MLKRNSIESLPLISVIIPFYNSEATLKRALLSIQLQTFETFECIMVDNNSTDNSSSIALEFVNSDSRFILLSETKQGVVYASNAAYDKSKAQYIARMDSDDESYPNRLKLQYDFLENNMDYGAVGSLVDYAPHKDNTEGFYSFVQWANSIQSSEQIHLRRFMELPIINPSAMWRRDISEEHGMYHNGDFPEDYEMWLRWLNNGVKIGKVAERLLKWYDSDSRLTRTDKIYSLESFYKVKTPFLVEFLKKTNPLFPKVAIWGASKTSRKRAKLLEDHGIEICCYIDITKKRQLEDPLLYYRDLPPKGQLYILVYVKQEVMRINIEKFLLKNSYSEGQDFIFVS